MRQETKEWIGELVLESPFIKSLDIELVSANRHTVHMRLPVRDKVAGVGSLIHSGAIASLADVAGTAAAIAGIDNSTPAACSVSQLSITHLSFVEGSYVEAKTSVAHRTDKQVVVDIMLTVDDRPLAKATAICRIFEQTGWSRAA